ncbi:collagen-like protein [Aquimarina aquimarini]|uniref:collagen-like protein n=1 Tax=Aquimarina aquimarini TaxID=1191734 RepID=UPI000D55EF52|nr:collagen-like protein [Aquimarina aquimarini]
MKKNYFKIVSKALLIGCLGVFLISCEGEDGENGIDGANGINGVDGVNGSNGTDGTNGENGTDGENGVGFDELTKYGKITLDIAGTRSDNVAFTHTDELKFIHNDAGNNDVFYNDPNMGFSVTRFVNSPDSHEDSSVRLSLSVNDVGLPTQNFEFNVRFDDYSVISDDLKYFNINSTFDQSNMGVSNATITDYSFDETTNNLRCTFTMTVAGANNITGNDMTISGTVDVIVLENLGGVRF